MQILIKEMQNRRAVQVAASFHQCHLRSAFTENLSEMKFNGNGICAHVQAQESPVLKEASQAPLPSLTRQHHCVPALTDSLQRQLHIF